MAMRTGERARADPSVYLTNGPKTYRKADWQEIVEQYSGCNLTHESDRLVALSGLASRQQETLNGVYLAGMWRRKIEDQLCWYRETSGLLFRNEIHMPSCSWASAKCQVRFVFPWNETFPNSSRFYRSRYDVPSVLDANGILATKSNVPPNHEYIYLKINLATVVDANTTLAISDPFGVVKGDKLTLRCRGLIQGIICRTEEQFLQDELRLNPIIILRVGDQLFGGKLYFDYELDNSEVPYYFLPIQTYKERYGKYTVDDLLGLLIVPTRSQQGEYRRVGMFELSSHFFLVLTTLPTFEDILEGLDLNTGDTNSEWLFSSSNALGKFLTLV
jgi:hypothetical protein